MRSSSSTRFIFVLLFSLFSASSARDSIALSQSLADGEFLVSLDGTFVLGFFNPPEAAGKSSNRYLGIWFATSNETVVWVANRDTPLTDSAGSLTVDATKGLLLLAGANSSAAAAVWSSRSGPGGGSARLLDSGNLVIIRANSNSSTEEPLWQSFDYPTNSLLAGMKLGPDFSRRRNRSLTSWRGPGDPGVGRYTVYLDPRGSPQFFLLDQDTVIYRSGPWNGLRFSGIPEMKSYDMFNFTVIAGDDETYYQFGITKPNIIARLWVDSDGVIQRSVLESSTWSRFWYAPKDNCDDYAVCGAYGVCNPNNFPICDCLPGFQPRNSSDWYLRIWNGGCARKTMLNCSSTGDGFRLVQQVKLPDTAYSIVNMSMSLGECMEMCLENCSCTAYANAYINGGGGGCVIWTGDLTDIREFTSDGQDLYLRLASSDLGAVLNNSMDKIHKKKIKKAIVAVMVATVLVIFLCGICGFCWCKKRNRKLMAMEGGTGVFYGNTDISREDPDVPMFDFLTIQSATNNFSDDHRIGEGGFGVVYKGILRHGQEVAVKRLSLHSKQGNDEFKNEVTLIAKLQHRNLVRLLGCCINGDERMLIYEYMPNKSLDAFIFDDQSRLLLDWRKRMDIIMGVARGLIYLHQDSRLRIIHRDLKAGNILLDENMNPKISDFGIARIFEGEQTEVTRRVVGTYGYMSPEYAMDGLFSIKSDVFSFGVLALEVISGKRNRWISQSNSKFNLLAQAWKLWKEGQSIEFLDDTLPCPCPLLEVFRCIQVGLLCVQEAPNDRPTMQHVVLMLGNENATLPQPKQPGFCTMRYSTTRDSLSTSQRRSHTLNEITLTDFEGR